MITKKKRTKKSLRRVKSIYKSIARSNKPQYKILKDIAILSGPIGRLLDKFEEDELYASLDAGESLLESNQPLYLDTENPLFIVLEHTLGSIPNEMRISKSYADKGFRRSLAFYSRSNSSLDHVCVRTDNPVETGLFRAAIHYLGRYLVAKVDALILTPKTNKQVLTKSMASWYMENNRPLPVEPTKQSNDSSLELPPIYEEVYNSLDAGYLILDKSLVLV
jgi:hypothetical protein